MRFAPFDLVALVVLALGWFHGRRHGLSELLADLATIVGGGIGATALSAPLAPLFGSISPANRLVAWLVVYFAIAVVLALVARRVRRKLREAELESLDKRFGALLGVVQAALIFSAATLVLAASSPSAATFVRASGSGALLGAFARAMQPALPERVAALFRPGIDALSPPPEPAPDPIASPRPRPSVTPRPSATPTPGSTQNLDRAPSRAPDRTPDDEPDVAPSRRPRERTDLDHEATPPTDAKEPKDPVDPLAPPR